MIKVSEAKQSPTNTKGRTEGKAFDELVASIKEKGVLQPVLARPMIGGGKIGKYEVVAGNRRLAAAREAGLEEIPAQIVDMTDAEAMEAQIVENLQRSDIHPMDEGHAYRNLIEASKMEVVAVAAKVGKSESYVKQRLYLTNLEPKAEASYRKGEINDGHAVLIAKLGSADQEKALKAATDRYNVMTVKELKEWIDANVYTSLDNQPWIKDAEMMKVVGECKECEPNRASLFGAVKEGACTDTKCWNRKMEAYVAHRVKTEKLVKVSDSYGKHDGMIGKGDYVLIAKRGKDGCENVETAIVAEGSTRGQTFNICRTPTCKDHGRAKSHYGLTPKEKAERKKEAAKEKAKQEKESAEFMETLEKKIKWPMEKAQLDKLVECVVMSFGSSVTRIVCKRHDFPEIKGPKNEYTKTPTTDWEKTLQKGAEGLDEEGKIRLVFEVALEHVWSERRMKFLKSL